MRERAGRKTSSRPCARSPQNSAGGSRRMRAGAASNSTIRGPRMIDTQAAHTALNTESGPSGDLSIRTLAMPADTNANGDIFGGWLLSQMDIGGGAFASKIAKSRTVTVAIEAMNFRKAVYVGDLVSVHAKLARVGRASVPVPLETRVLRR